MIFYSCLELATIPLSNSMRTFAISSYLVNTAAELVLISNDSEGTILHNMSISCIIKSFITETSVALKEKGANLFTSINKGVFLYMV